MLRRDAVRWPSSDGAFAAHERAVAQVCCYVFVKLRPCAVCPRVRNLLSWASVLALASREHRTVEDDAPLSKSVAARRCRTRRGAAAASRRGPNAVRLRCPDALRESRFTLSATAIISAALRRPRVARPSARPAALHVPTCADLSVRARIIAVSVNLPANIRAGLSAVAGCPHAGLSALRRGARESSAARGKRVQRLVHGGSRAARSRPRADARARYR
jgi:hypothetical protein